MADIKKDADLELYNKLFSEQELYLDLWLKCQRLYNSKFTDKQEKSLTKKRRSKIFIPITRNTINIIKAIFATTFFSNGNPIEILPVHDNEEKELVIARNKILDYYYEQYKPAKELVKAFQSALTFGMGIVITYWEESKKRVVTTQIPITDIAFDNECNNIDDIEVIAYKSYESTRVTLQKEVYKKQIDKAYAEILSLNNTISSLNQQIRSLNNQLEDQKDTIACLMNTDDSEEFGCI